MTFRTLMGLLLAAALAAAPAPAWSAPPASLDAAAPAADSPEAEAYWRGRAADARQRVEVARERVARIDQDYGKMRHRRKQRGEAKEGVLNQRDAAYAELEAALRYLEQVLPEEARRAGALPGWVR